MRGLALLGYRLQWFVAMSLGSASVIANALRLRRVGAVVHGA